MPVSVASEASAHPGRRPFDLIAMGRAIVDVYGEQVGCRLEEVTSFAKYVGGCPANVAIGTARLGLKVAMVTRVGDEQHGRFIREQLAREGVDVSCVKTDPERATGVAFLGIRDKETFPLLHYREDCADMAIAHTDYSAAFIGSATALLFSGSHLTTDAASENIAQAVAAARAGGTRVVFDIDYRPLFWGLARRDAGESRFVESTEVTRASQRFLPSCDLVVGTEEEIRITGGCSDTLDALREIRQRTHAVIVLKRGARGCIVFDGSIPAQVEHGLTVPGFPVDVFNVVGAGDGFLSGFLYGWLRGRSLDECGRDGNACGALVVSRHGCSPASPTEPELIWFLNRGAGPPDLYRNRQLAQLHRATTRRERPAFIAMVECDDDLGTADLRIVRGRTLAQFKSLVAEVVLEINAECAGIGIALDGVDGQDALYRLGSTLPWVARRIDIADRRPLTFIDDGTAGIELQAWPTHQIVKCRVSQAAGGEAIVQMERLRELHLACLHYGHECLFELVVDERTVIADILAQIGALHARGMLPDWWMLPVATVNVDWRELEHLIRDTNAACRGVLLCGTPQRVREGVGFATGGARSSLLKGFAIASAALTDLAAAWLRGEADSAHLYDELRTRLRAQLAFEDGLTAH